jgi:hypothetical protein
MRAATIHGAGSPALAGRVVVLSVGPSNRAEQEQIVASP